MLKERPRPFDRSFSHDHFFRNLDLCCTCPSLTTFLVERNVKKLTRELHILKLFRCSVITQKTNLTHKRRKTSKFRSQNYRNMLLKSQSDFARLRSSTRALAASCSCSISKDGALQPSFGTNMYMSLLEFSATADVGVSVLSVDSSSLFHSSCKRTASLKSSNSDGGTTGGNGKLQVVVVLRLGKFIAYSSSKIRFFGLMPFVAPFFSFRVYVQLHRVNE